MPGPHPAETLVTVTGASGFIALHCVRELLERGYRVRGTVRDLGSEAKLRKALLPLDSGSRLSFVAAELLADKGWAEAMAGATYLLHVASPVPKGPPKDENEVIRPARDGARRVLLAAREAGVRRVVMTSSIAAIIAGRERDAGHPFDETIWSDLTQPIGAYEKSKTLAEQAAWEIAREPQARPFELTTINPSYVLGPSLTGADNVSNEIVGKMVRREVPGIPRFHFGVVDVRDVATAHVLAMTTEKAAGERFIVSSDEAWMKEMADVMAAAGFKVPTRVVPNFAVRILAIFDPTIRLVIGNLGKKVPLTSDKAKNLLGWTGRSMREMVVDTATSMMARATSAT
jgi:dihydroflavonol-4-reductase